ncbi:MAG: TRAP transporter small permease [Pseudomonadota bacterium]|nr:TRAP transporter small permease [Pseudomonadota bacterium]
MAAMITLNVVSRWIGRAIIPDDILIVQELMVLVILFPLGVVTAARGHISVDLLTEWVRQKGRYRLAVLEHCIGLIMMGGITYAAWRGFVQAWDTQDYYSGTLDIPMWIGHASFLFGSLVFLMRLFAMLISDIRASR